MKFKTTAKEIRKASAYRKTIAVGYCAMQYLLWNHEPIAYTCGVYGWNFDVYNVHGVVICTGYRGMIGKDPNYEQLTNYERQAEKVKHNYDLTYEEQCEEIEKLLLGFLSSCC